VRPARPPLGAGFGRLFTANLSSSLGDGIARTALPLLGARLTDDPLLIAGIAALSLLPWLLFAIPAGIVVDRIDRRAALALAQGVRVAVGLLLVGLTATGTLTIWWLYLVVFVYGAFETLYDGAVRAVVPSLVERADLPRANSRIEAGELVVQNFLAGPVTSFLFAAVVLVPLGANVVVFAVAGILALLLPRAASGREHPRHREDEVAWFRQFADGYRFLRGSPMLFKLWLVSTVHGLFSAFAIASLVLFVLGPLGVPEALYGTFMLCGAVGAVVGSLAAARLASRWGSGPVMAAALVLGSLAVTAMGIMPIVPVALVGFAVSSGSILVWNVLIISLRQSLVPHRLLGRVHGTWRTLMWGAMPLGSIVGGLMGRIDLALPLIVGGGASAVVALLYYRFIRSLPDPRDLPAV